MPIVLEKASYTYAPGTPYEAAALCDIDLQIADGEFIGIMGHTGSGKSTLLQLIAGLITPSRGKVMIDGCDINARNYNRDVLRKKLSMIFQYPEYQLFETTVEKELAFSLKHSGLPGKEVKERVRRALEAVGFSYTRVRSLSPLGLSGGEKRKVAIACALVTEPKILLLDEPVAGLDPRGRKEFLEIITRRNKAGTTIIMVSHDADVLGNYAQRILVLNQGKLLLDGPAKRVFTDIEKLEALKLGVCRPRKLARRLKECGIPFPQDIAGYDEFIAAVVEVSKKGGMSHEPDTGRHVYSR
ncbi:MAG: energy-coupling factor transporter ATPase [Firmicutes bacterium]|jgi:energy-coupling factor transport system ATP-binding protein|nr:energy-coupling factor transporter ATPase [Bacillota bacterium]